MAENEVVEKKYISQITLPGQEEPYYIKDAEARLMIQNLGNIEGLVFVGVFNTEQEVEAIENPEPGMVAIAGAQEYIYIEIEKDGATEGKWEPFGPDLSNLGELAYMDVENLYVDWGTTSTGEINFDYADVYALPQSSPQADSPEIEGTGFCTPLGSVEVTPTEFVVTPAKTNTTSGTAAAWSATVNNETLSFSWTANTPTEVPSQVVTDIASTSLALDATFAGEKSNVTVSTPMPDYTVYGTAHYEVMDHIVLATQ